MLPVFQSALVALDTSATAEWNVVTGTVMEEIVWGTEHTGTAYRYGALKEREFKHGIQ